jgi:hypothetical protein
MLVVERERGKWGQREMAVFQLINNNLDTFEKYRCTEKGRLLEKKRFCICISSQEQLQPM